MKTYKNILATVDFSELSQAVIESASALANRNEAKLTVLNVVDYAWQNAVDYIQPGVNEVEAKLLNAAHERLDSLLNSHEMNEVEKRVVSGEPKQEIVRVAEQIEADIIIIGAHGHHGLRDMLGSTTDRIVHRAGCDVLVIRR